MTELRILVCVKRVPAPGARITLTADRQSIDSKNLGFATSPHEECAVEGAIQLVEAHGGQIDVESVEGEGSVFTISLPRYRSGGAMPMNRIAKT